MTQCVFLRDVTGAEQEYVERLLDGEALRYFAKVHKSEDSHGRASKRPRVRLLVLGAYRLFTIKKRITGLAVLRQGHVEDLESMTLSENRTVLRVTFRKGYDPQAFVVTIPWETPLASSLVRCLWSEWFSTGGALLPEEQRPHVNDALREVCLASVSADDLGEEQPVEVLNAALYKRLRHYARRAPKPTTLRALQSSQTTLDLSQCADDTQKVSKLDLVAIAAVLRASKSYQSIELNASSSSSSKPPSTGGTPPVNCKLDAEALRDALLPAAADAGVRSLTLAEAGVIPATLDGITLSAQLQALDLSRNALGDRGALALAAGLAPCGVLKVLRLRKCQLRPQLDVAGLVSLVERLLRHAEARSSSSDDDDDDDGLEVLDLAQNALGATGVAAVAVLAGSAWCRLRALDLDDCQSPLTSLAASLSGTICRDRGVSRGIAATLEYLDLSRNLVFGATDDGARRDALAVAAFVRDASVLRTLKIAKLRYASALGSVVSADATDALCREGVQRSTSLTAVDVSGSNLGACFSDEDDEGVMNGDDATRRGSSWPSTVVADDCALSAGAFRGLGALDGCETLSIARLRVGHTHHPGGGTGASGGPSSSRDSGAVAGHNGSASSSSFVLFEHGLSTLAALHLQETVLARRAKDVLGAIPPRLVVLNVTNCHGGDDALEALSRYLKATETLRELSCDGQRRISFDALKGFAAGVKAATSLSGVSEDEDDDLAYVSRKSAPLLELAPPLTDAARLARHSPDDAPEIAKLLKRLRRFVRDNVKRQTESGDLKDDGLLLLMAQATCDVDDEAPEAELPRDSHNLTTNAVVSLVDGVAPNLVWRPPPSRAASIPAPPRGEPSDDDDAPGAAASDAEVQQPEPQQKKPVVVAVVATAPATPESAPARKNNPFVDDDDDDGGPTQGTPPSDDGDRPTPVVVHVATSSSSKEANDADAPSTRVDEPAAPGRPLGWTKPPPPPPKPRSSPKLGFLDAIKLGAQNLTAADPTDRPAARPALGTPYAGLGAAVDKVLGRRAAIDGDDASSSSDAGGPGADDDDDDEDW
eukprot:CAMPEP_0185695688 /NCGR_PEP_ID=MMETSP1164-20130828/4670_1 /TAXON_ID=1104430 /ORGANISM="Chrysoreinhardia sp, Strain CCMP2950" /LENGTH=1049 /DNA_ID=CAMNT_0028362551 /DNA_START=23 /DNA_END=3172 /DNA_ORIENTATION=+